MSRTKQLFWACPLALSTIVPLTGIAHAEQPPPKSEQRLKATVYGFLNAQVERAWALGGVTPYLARNRVADGGSRLGFRGSYALGLGTKALWQIEGALIGWDQGGISDQGSPIVLTSRNTFVGMEQEHFGRFLVGHLDSPYRSLVGSGGRMGGNLGLTVLGLDLWNNTDAQLTGTPKNIFSRGEARYGNSVSYYTPEWRLPLPFDGWFQLGASYSFDEALAKGQDRSRYSFAGLVTLGWFAVGAAYDRRENTGVDVEGLRQGFGQGTRAEPGVSTYFYKVVASFLAPTGTYFGIGFERSNYGYAEFVPPSLADYHARLVTGVMEQDGGMASLAQRIGRLTVMSSVGVLWNLTHSILGPGSDYRARQYSFGGKYSLSDVFGVYAFYTAIQNQPRQDVNLGAPVYSNDLGTAQATLAPGNSPRAFGMGLIARF